MKGHKSLGGWTVESLSPVGYRQSGFPPLFAHQSLDFPCPAPLRACAGQQPSDRPAVPEMHSPTRWSTGYCPPNAAPHPEPPPWPECLDPRVVSARHPPGTSPSASCSYPSTVEVESLPRGKWMPPMSDSAAHPGRALSARPEHPIDRRESSEVPESWCSSRNSGFLARVLRTRWLRMTPRTIG